MGMFRVGVGFGSTINLALNSPRTGWSSGVALPWSIPFRNTYRDLMGISCMQPCCEVDELTFHPL